MSDGGKAGIEKELEETTQAPRRYTPAGSGNFRGLLFSICRLVFQTTSIL